MSKRRYIAGQPHLLRRRGKGRQWTGWIEGKEVALGTADRAGAQHRLETLAAERSQTRGRNSPAEPLLLAEAAFLFAQHCRPPRHTAQTARSYSQRLARFVAWAEEKGITRTDQITLPLLTRFTRERGDEDRGAATINRDLSAVRSLFAFLEREGHVAESPLHVGTAFRKVKLREPRPRPDGVTLAPDQVDGFVAKSSKVSPRGYASLFALTAGSAIRIDEARHIDESDVDAGRGVLTITPKPGWTTKGYRYRQVPISKRTAEAALEFIATRGTVPLDDKSVWTEIKRVREMLDLPQFSMHDLRRAWASAVHANGASLKQVSVWLGHGSVRTTERYIKLLGDASAGHEFLPR